MGENKVLAAFTPAEVGAEVRFELLKFREVAQWLVTRLHPSGMWCPRCSHDMGVDSPRRWEKWYALEQVRCPDCGKRFTAATGTLLDGSKLEPREIFMLADYLDLEVPPRRIAARLKLDIGTVRSWQQKFQAVAEVASV